MVENLNDNPPMFYSEGVVVEEVQVNVTEQQPAGTIVLLLEVRYSCKVPHPGHGSLAHPSVSLHT